MVLFDLASGHYRAQDGEWLEHILDGQILHNYQCWRGEMMKTFHSRVTAMLLFGLLYTHGSTAAQKAPPKPTGTAVTAAEEQVTPEEAKKRKDWALSMHKKTAPKKGCFTATYPDTEWKEVPCKAAPKIPMVPRRGVRPFVVGNANDVSAEAPTGFITQVIGHFENITNVTSETGLIGNSGTPVNNAYSLQINANFFTSTACSGSPNPSCRGWEQFVYFNDGSSGSVFIQYWLIQYNATCPAGQNWNQFSFTGSTDIYCFKNDSAGAVGVPNQPIINIGNWTLTGTATSTGDSVAMSTGTNVFTVNGDNAVNLSNGWTTAEFNVFGAGGSSAGGGQANFNSGASVDTRTEIIYGGTTAPNCVAAGFTGETNNLSFGPTAPAATAPGPAVIFQESIAGGATSDCAAAATIGDTHLRTFNGLFYDFQAAGDFTLAEVNPGFSVQTRQVSGAPTWPNATVNKGVAARFGETKVAVCLPPPGSNQLADVHVNGKLTAVPDGKTLELPGGIGIARQNNVYQLTSEDGDSVRAEINPGYINVNVGLGRWPSSVHGLIANPNGNANQIQTRDGVMLTNPFSFDDLYHRFADSWRVPERESMLSACNTEKSIEVGIPKQPFYAKDLEPEIRQKSQGVCTAAGVKPGPLFEACTLDVAVIGQDAAAKVFVGAIPPATVGTIAGGGGAGFLEKNWWWLLLVLLALILLVWFLMRKKP
ncbi:MAG TPA: hypothetical protein VGK36_10005 [Candidatus Angelobacter sp.]